MIKHITSENPADHWRFLNVKDKIVMDMGCSFWDSTWNEDWLSSSEYFVSKGAKKVIGFDAAKHDIDRYNELYQNDIRYEIFHLYVNDKLGLEFILNKYKPQVIKCDIEGAEINFEDLNLDIFENIEEMAIEYHNGPTLEMCKKYLPIWGFKNIDIYQLHGLDLNSVGVYHAWK
jgi:hypothetical protein